MIFTSFKTHLDSLRGLQRYVALFCLGALLTLAMPPFGLFPVLFVSIPALSVLTRSAPSRFRSFLCGWAFGAGYFIFGLYWISAALFVDIDTWKWVLPLSLILGPAVLGVFYGFATLLAHRYRAAPAAHALALCAAFSLIEWLRGHVLTGFPWNLAGYSWDHVLPLQQPAAVFGIYGLTLLTLFWACLPVFMKHHARLTHVAILSLFFALGAGSLRLALYPTVPNGDVTVRVVQANIPEENKWNKDDDFRNFEKHLALTAAPSRLDHPPTFVIWPETALKADLSQFPEFSNLIHMKMPKGSMTILGTLRVDDSVLSAPKFYNSVTLLGPDGKVVQEYNKHHLVPFGEYIPFRDKIGMTPIGLAVAGIGDFTRGGGPLTEHMEGLPSFSPLICYEAIFPHEAVDPKDRPDWLVNVTNDGWYGNSAGPYQHFASARMRAIEEGLPLARAANTGISGIIDPVGRVLARQPLLTQGYAESALPLPLPPTIYAGYGDVPFALLLIIFTIFAETLRSRRRNPDVKAG